MKYLSFLAFLIVLRISCASAAKDENAQVSGQPLNRTQIGKVERSFVIKAPLSEMFDIWSTKLPLVPTICPTKIRSVDVLQGLWGEEGSVIVWKYNQQGKGGVEKDVMEVVDKENNRIVYKVTEGGPLDFYKNFTWIYQAYPNDKVVLWTLEYEKDNEDDPEQTRYLDLLAFLMKRIDAYLTTY